jgi:hypothetical protein
MLGCRLISVSFRSFLRADAHGSAAPVSAVLTHPNNPLTYNNFTVSTFAYPRPLFLANS